MKYSFMTFSCPELSLDEALALARRLGYDGIEPRTSSNHAHGIEPEIGRAARLEIRRKVADSGVALSCIATSHRYANPAEAQAAVEGTIQSVQLAADVGAPCIRVFGGQLAEGLSREAAIDLVADCLRKAAEATKDSGVTICIETHDDWCVPAHLAEVVRRVNMPHVAINWDIMHPVRRGNASMDEAWQALHPWVRHVHFHDGMTVDGKPQMVPIGTGEIDHRRAVQLLKKARYTGFLSGEWIRWEGYETHLPRELATMKSYEREQ